MAYLVIEFDPDPDTDTPLPGGVHKPLRSDGYYAREEVALGQAKYWAERPMMDRSHIAVVEIKSWAKK